MVPRDEYSYKKCTPFIRHLHFLCMAYSPRLQRGFSRRVDSAGKDAHPLCGSSFSWAFSSLAPPSVFLLGFVVATVMWDAAFQGAVVVVLGVAIAPAPLSHVAPKPLCLKISSMHVL